ncbi:hypothetical protein BDB01DRAFT_907646 [Pilobolus umbonatus]|nr:hypothetical protein BDB01DRAFT_907646 [Pilobolus umbonatus]
MSMFPQGYFYILSRKNGFALDVADKQGREDSGVIVWSQKFQDNDTQLWAYDDGRIINKSSGLVLDINSSAFKKDKTIVQKKRKPVRQSQEWIFDQGFICSKEYPTLVLDIKGDSSKDGAPILLYKRKESDNLNQLWQFEPYQQFEGALNMATTSIPLHKKPEFGQPRLGYAAEIGVPPELTSIPENNKIAGVGNNISSLPTDSRVDPALAQYGSFYGQPSPSQPNNESFHNTYPPQSNNQSPYPPSVPTNSASYPTPVVTSNAPFPSTYPPPPNPPPADNNPNNFYPPPNSPPRHSVNLASPYPPQQYPPVSNQPYPQSSSSQMYPQSGSSNYPQTTPGYPQPSLSAGYPQPSLSAGYPQPSLSAGYPPPPPTHFSSSPPRYPPSPSSNQFGAQSPQSGQFGAPYGSNYSAQPYPPPPNFPPPSEAGDPQGYYPPPAGYPPPSMPNANPSQSPYGYPSYPQ